MRVQLKPLHEQVMVITGATSGIGLATARMAAEAGAKVVLGARDGEMLVRIVEKLRENGADADFCEVDVADEMQVRLLAEVALHRFGRIDTWVNNAGVSIYGTVMDTPDRDARRLFDTNYWGVLNGCRVAVEHLSAEGGALINVGSTVGDRAVPLQGAYCASKHAVKGLTNALRMELEAEGRPVSVTLIKPGAINTRYEAHAKVLTGAEPLNPPPVYEPDTVARAILHAAVKPERDIIVGFGGKLLSMSETWTPRTADRLMERFLIPWEQSGGDLEGHRDGLHQPGDGGWERGTRHDYTRSRSYYTMAALNPLATAAIMAGVGALLYAATGGREQVRTLVRARRPASGRYAVDHERFDNDQARLQERGPYRFRYRPEEVEGARAHSMAQESR
ncbi:MAG TPA: SDR family oxidoreductase [Azospirillaceae bacterium]|nr:SDR family oxidoreductase [Azospirillaceae bacterium]